MCNPTPWCPIYFKLQAYDHTDHIFVSVINKRPKRNTGTECGVFEVLYILRSDEQVSILLHSESIRIILLLCWWAEKSSICDQVD